MYSKKKIEYIEKHPSASSRLSRCAIPDAAASCSHSATLNDGSCRATTAISRLARSGFSASLCASGSYQLALRDERLAEAYAGVAAQLDEPPRVQRTVVGRRGRRLHERQRTACVGAASVTTAWDCRRRTASIAAEPHSAAS